GGFVAATITVVRGGVDEPVGNEDCLVATGNGTGPGLDGHDRVTEHCDADHLARRAAVERNANGKVARAVGVVDRGVAVEDHGLASGGGVARSDLVFEHERVLKMLSTVCHWCVLSGSPGS